MHSSGRSAKTRAWVCFVMGACTHILIFRISEAPAGFCAGFEWVCFTGHCIDHLLRGGTAPRTGSPYVRSPCAPATPARSGFSPNPRFTRTSQEKNSALSGFFPPPLCAPVTSNASMGPVPPTIARQRNHLRRAHLQRRTDRLFAGRRWFPLQHSPVSDQTIFKLLIVDLLHRHISINRKACSRSRRLAEGHEDWFHAD